MGRGGKEDGAGLGEYGEGGEGGEEEDGIAVEDPEGYVGLGT